MLDAALRFLEVRPRSIAEVRRRLALAGYPEALITSAVARLVDLGMLDDTEFARLWVESRDRAHPRGERALRRELAVKGIASSTVDAILAGRASQHPGSAEGADAAAAARLLQRHGAALARVGDPRVRRQRAYALLARHGFDSDIARSLAARVPDESMAAEDIDRSDAGGDETSGHGPYADDD